MLYLIPAWYQDNTWNEKEQIWYTRRMHTEFDDSVKQIQLFYRTGTIDFKIMLLSYAPNFRHFLHRQSIYHVPYWSCFDAIQEVNRSKAVVFSFHNLAWPEHIEFVYTPFAIVALYKGEKYAQVEFGEDGNPIEVNMYSGGVICRKNIYDDRGFVSSTILYENGKQIYQDYLTEEGIWKIREYKADGHVEINPKIPFFMIQNNKGEYEKISFLRLEYERMEIVIEEVLEKYLQDKGENNLFCEAVHLQHMSLIQRLIQPSRLILSFYSVRGVDIKNESVIKAIYQAGYIVTDSKSYTKELVEKLGHNIANIMDITPYDTRVDMGISAQLHVHKIMVPIDGLSEELFEQIIVATTKYFEKNPYARIYLFTRQANYSRISDIVNKVQMILQNYNLPMGYVLGEQERNVIAENNIDNEYDVEQKIFVEQCVSELEVSKCMKEQRVILDLRNSDDLYLRISAISMGIPQILLRESQFVIKNRNGIVINDDSDIADALSFYLMSIKNWNTARISAYEMSKEYSTDRLVEKWRKVLKELG